LTKAAMRCNFVLPNPENYQERGTQFSGAHRHMARGNLIDPSPSANLVGIDEENLRNRTEGFPPQIRSRRLKPWASSIPPHLPNA
jgi:hypothetical protein